MAIDKHISYYRGIYKLKEGQHKIDQAMDSVVQRWVLYMDWNDCEILFGILREWFLIGIVILIKNKHSPQKPSNSGHSKKMNYEDSQDSGKKHTLSHLDYIYLIYITTYILHGI